MRSLVQGFERLVLLPRLSLPILLTLSLTLAALLSVTAMVTNLSLKALPDIKAEDNLYTLDYKMELSDTLKLSILTEQRLATLATENQSFGTFSSYHVRERELEVAGNFQQVSKFKASLNFPDNVANLQLRLGEQPNIDNIINGVWLSYSLWKNVYHNDPNIIGKLLDVETKTLQIKGVYSDFNSFTSFSPRHQQQIWTYYDFQSQLGKVDNYFLGGSLNVLFRKTDNVFGEKQLKNFWQGYLDNHQELGNLAESILTMKVSFNSVPYRDVLMKDQDTMLMFLLLTVLVLLTMACLNLLNLFIAHYQQRRAEFATQIFLGGNLKKIQRMIFLENLPTFILACFFGLLTSAWIIRLLPDISSGNIELLELVQLDTFTVTVAFAIVILINGIFTKVASSQFKEQQLLSELNNGNKGVNTGKLGLFPKILFIGQISFAVVILTGSAMLAQMAYHKLNVDLGFTIGNTLVAEVQMAGELEELPEEEVARRAAIVRRFHQARDNQNQLAKAVKTVHPNVKVLDSQDGPFGLQYGMATSINPATDKRISFNVRNIAPGYFEAFNVPIIAGRNITDEEFISYTNVALINEQLANLLAPDGDINKLLGTEFNTRQIVGIVANTYDLMTESESGHPTILRSVVEMNNLRLIMQFTTDTSIDLVQLSTIIEKVNSQTKKVRITNLKQYWSDKQKDERVQFYFIVTISLLTLFLAALGSIGMATNYTELKRFELAIRMATGASRKSILHNTLKSFIGLVFWSLIMAVIVTLSTYLLLINAEIQLPAFSWKAMALFFSILITTVFCSIVLVVWKIINKDPLQALREQ
jgi:ABC-type antimicrobial peptide transport system permease subunit